MAVFSHRDFDQHELVLFIRDAAANLSAIVAIHDAGPMGMAGGGCRMWPYATDEDALEDVLRLSKAMTYKLAIAGLPAGGAKSVIIGDPSRDKTDALFEAFGAAVNRLGGRYIVGEDVGTNGRDLEVMRRKTDFVMVGRQDTTGATGHGVFFGLKTAVKRRLGREDLTGLKVAVQGVGGVGFQLSRRLKEAGATVYVADVNQDAVRRAVDALGVEPVSLDGIFGMDVDVLSPCALGGVLDDATISSLRCKVVAGGANNQLAEPRHGDVLKEKGILYAPDFVINAGGVIGAAFGAAEDAEEAKVLKQVEKVADYLGEVFDRADAEGVSTEEAAEQIAKERLGRSR